MNTAISLANGENGAKPQVGDLVKVQIFIDEKIGNAGDHWQLSAPAGAAWQSAGGVTAQVGSLKLLPSEGATTKLEFTAVVHQPGPLVVGPLLIRDETTQREIPVAATPLNGVDSAAPQTTGQEPWILGPVDFGGWNWWLLGLLSLLLALGIALLARWLWRFYKRERATHLTPAERALSDIANLQKYTKSKRALELEEWKKFSFELAGILRKFSDQNLQIDSSDMTDREFLYELQLHPTAAPFVSQVVQVLSTITEVRYGRKELDATLVPGLLLSARKYVENTAPKPKETGARK